MQAAWQARCCNTALIDEQKCWRRRHVGSLKRSRRLHIKAIAGGSADAGSRIAGCMLMMHQLLACEHRSIQTTATEVRPMTAAAGKPLLSLTLTAVRRATYSSPLSCPRWHPELNPVGGCCTHVFQACCRPQPAAAWPLASPLTRSSDTPHFHKMSSWVCSVARLAAEPAAPAAGTIALCLPALHRFGWLRLQG